MGYASGSQDAVRVLVVGQPAARTDALLAGLSDAVAVEVVVRAECGGVALLLTVRETEPDMVVLGASVPPRVPQQVFDEFPGLLVLTDGSGGPVAHRLTLESLDMGERSASELAAAIRETLRGWDEGQTREGMT